MSLPPLLGALLLTLSALVPDWNAVDGVRYWVPSSLLLLLLLLLSPALLWATSPELLPDLALVAVVSAALEAAPLLPPGLLPHQGPGIWPPTLCPAVMLLLLPSMLVSGLSSVVAPLFMFQGFNHGICPPLLLVLLALAPMVSASSSALPACAVGCPSPASSAVLLLLLLSLTMSLLLVLLLLLVVVLGQNGSFPRCCCRPPDVL
jgi:hypothetical protein